MPNERKSQFPILNELKELAKETDHYIQDFIQNDFEAWFHAFRDAAFKIRDCISITDNEEFGYPTDLKNVFGEINKKADVSVDDIENTREHLHGEKCTSSSEKQTFTEECQDKDELDSNILSNIEVIHKLKINGSKICPTVVLDRIAVSEHMNNKNSEVELSVNVSKKESEKNLLTPKPITLAKKVEAYSLYKSILLSNSHNSQQLYQTPVMNGTFNKILDKTRVLDSGSSDNNSVKRGNTVNIENSNSSVKTKSSVKIKSTNEALNNQRQKLDEQSDHLGTSGNNVLRQTPLMNRTFNKISDKTQVLDSGSSNNNTVKRENTLNSNSSVKTRSSVKRKSTNEALNNKRQKLDEQSNHSGNKVLRSKPPVVEKHTSKTAPVTVIIPSVPVKPVTVPKEEQILKEIKKKEEKASENLKRVLAERQMKADEIKKKREEKREKMLQKRMQLEKEKQAKRDVELKTSQVKKTPVLKTRVKQVIENIAKDKKSGLGINHDSNSTELVKTPCNKMSRDSDNYDMTPLPDSSTYDIESDDEKPKRKPIPLWAQGVQLKNAIIRQNFCSPLNIDDIFDTYIEPPNLAEMFGIQKKRYKQRTSSAVWNSPPGLSLRH